MPTQPAVLFALLTGLIPLIALMVLAYGDRSAPENACVVGLLIVWMSLLVLLLTPPL